MAAESEDPFSKVRIVLFAFGSISALMGLLFTLPRSVGSVLGAPRAAPVTAVLQDVAINGGAATVLGYLAYQELKTDSGREEMREESALLSRLTVWLPRGGSAGSVELVRLSDLRAARSGRPRWPVLCIGDLPFCLACIEAAAKVAEAVTRADLLLVPALTSNPSERSTVVMAAQGLDYVAIPPEASACWSDLVGMQAAKVRSQNLDETKGQVMIVSKTGRVAARFLGVPDWELISRDIGGRQQPATVTTDG